MTEKKIKNDYALEDVVKAVLTVLQSDVQETEKLAEKEGYVQTETVKTYKCFDDYPDVLQAKHCRAILGLSEAKTYEMLNSKKCPSFTIGKNKRVSKSAFIQYLADCQGQDLID